MHALLMGYEDTPPEGVTIPDDKFYNHVFPGHAIGMPPPLADGQVPYANEDGSAAPDEMMTVEQYSRDVSAFLMWVAEPHLNDQKAAGFRVLTFLLLFATLMWLVKQRLWRQVH
jgi:ubiquinol-cytochrome c reductase cytochrome c1 subunit